MARFRLKEALVALDAYFKNNGLPNCDNPSDDEITLAKSKGYIRLALNNIQTVIEQHE